MVNDGDEEVSTADNDIEDDDGQHSMLGHFAEEPNEPFSVSHHQSFALPINIQV